MLIRTQDKLNLVNLEKLNGITIEPSDEKEGMFDIIGELDGYSEFDYLLGTYSSESNAMLVMTMIESHYEHYYRGISSSYKGMISVFYMPDMNEVNIDID